MARVEEGVTRFIEGKEHGAYQLHVVPALHALEKPKSVPVLDTILDPLIYEPLSKQRIDAQFAQGRIVNYWFDSPFVSRQVKRSGSSVLTIDGLTSVTNYDPRKHPEWLTPNVKWIPGLVQQLTTESHIDIIAGDSSFIIEKGNSEFAQIVRSLQKEAEWDCFNQTVKEEVVAAFRNIGVTVVADNSIAQHHEQHRMGIIGPEVKTIAGVPRRRFLLYTAAAASLGVGRLAGLPYLAAAKPDHGLPNQTPQVARWLMEKLRYKRVHSPWLKGRTAIMLLKNEHAAHELGKPRGESTSLLIGVPHWPDIDELEGNPQACIAAIKEYRDMMMQRLLARRDQIPDRFLQQLYNNLADFLARYDIYTYKSVENPFDMPVSQYALQSLSYKGSALCDSIYQSLAA